MYVNVLEIVYFEKLTLTTQNLNGVNLISLSLEFPIFFVKALTECIFQVILAARKTFTEFIYLFRSERLTKILQVKRSLLTLPYIH